MANSYDIFLSFKATDQCGSTQDVAVANELYNTLTAYGFQVFFSNRTIPEIGNSDFSKEIDCALDTAQLLIVVASQLSYLSSPWVEYEWKTFHSDILSNLKPNAQIVTYTQGIDTVQFPRVLRYIQNFEYSSKDRLLEFALAFFQKQQNGQFHHLAVSQKMAQNNTIIYNSAFNGEFELLRIRARRSYALDIQAISYVKKHMNRKKFNVLVLGCAYGFVAETRFGLDDDIENVICVDKNPEVIEKAKALYRNYPHMKFLVADVLSDNYVLEIKRELEKMSITGIDFMFTSDTFRYLTNPRTAIRNTRKLLQSDGMVIIRDSDDSNKLAYPDNGGYLSDIVEYSAKALEMPNYYIGRELPLLLLNSGFSISDIRIDLRTTINMTYEEKEEFFLSTLGSRRSIAKQVMASTTNSKAELETIISSVDKLENCFYDGDFWYSESNLIFIAKRS